MTKRDCDLLRIAIRTQWTEIYSDQEYPENVRLPTP